MLQFNDKLVFFSITVHCFLCLCVNAGSRGETLEEKNVDKISLNILNTLPIREINSLLPQILSRALQNPNNAEKKKKISYEPAPLRQQALTAKKSFVENDKISPIENPTAYQLAITEPGVYLRYENKFNKARYASEKRFSIPQPDKLKLPNKTPEEIPLASDDIPTAVVASEIKPILRDGLTTDSERRTKRRVEDDLDDERDSDMQDERPADLAHQYTLAMPTVDQDAQLRSGVNGINSGVMAVVPVKVERPMVISTVPSIALTSTGTEKSAFPVTNLVQPVEGKPLIQTRPIQSLLSLKSGSDPVEKQEGLSSFVSQPKTSVIKLAPLQQQNPVIKLAQLPLGDETPVIKFAKVPVEEQTPVVKQEHYPVKEQNPVIKLAHVPVEILDSVDETKTNKKTKSQEDEDETSNKMNENMLKSLQLKLTNIISKLEEKVNKKEGKKKKLNEKERTKKLEKSKVNEASLKFLKFKLSRVLSKFNSRPGVTQPFTVGKEWSHLLDDGSHRGKHFKKVSSSESSQTSSSPANGNSLQEENWPSIASQLLGKLNKALSKLQERKVAKSLEKSAVMYFNFDNVKSSTNDDNTVQDNSGHLNDATLSDNAHISSRRYGSCGKALILNSGNLRYVEKYFKDKPTKAITLAMWVRTNATGFVRWFAQDSGTSREFSTSTQYPLVRKNVWTHLCGTFNSSTGVTRIYVDGELKAEKVNMKRDNTMPADFTPAGIGSDFGDGNLIAVDEVYMFSRTLSEKEVQAVYDNCEFNRMVLHYGFQKVNRTAGIVVDQSGLNNNALLKGEANVLDGGCDKCGSCLDLNAKGNPRLTIQGNQFKHRPTKAISLAAWINLNSTTGTHPLVDVPDFITKTSLLNLHVTDGKLKWEGRDKKQNTIFDLSTDQSVVPEGIWVHVLVTYNSFSGLANIFVDGHEKAFVKTARKIPIGEDWGEIQVGGKAIGSSDLGGYIDEFAVYNWELDSSEISYVMKYCPDHPKLVSFTVHVPLE